MEKLCFKKYRHNSILFCVLLICTVILGVLSGGFMGLFAILCGVLGFGGFAAYYLYAYITYRKRCRDLVPQEGVIANWQVDTYMGRASSRWARVTVKVDEKEYASPTCFRLDEAQAMVGKRVSYVILEDTLLIYEILH